MAIRFTDEVEETTVEKAPTETGAALPVSPEPVAQPEVQEPVVQEPQSKIRFTDSVEQAQPKSRIRFTDVEETQSKIDEVGQIQGIANAAMNAFDASRQSMAVAGGVSPEEAEEISRLEYQKEARKVAPAYQEYLEAQGLDAVKAFAKNPLEITTNIVAEGLAGSLYSLGAGLVAGGTAAGATALTGVGAPLAPAAFLGGQIGGTFAGSLATEYGSKVLEELQNAGMDIKDSESIQKFFADEKLVEQARTQGLKRGVPVAIFDGVSVGIAGRLARAPIAQVLKKTPTRLAATEAAAQAGLGGGGEIAGALVAGEEIQPKAVFAEVLGEAGPAAAEITVGRIATKLAETPEQKQLNQNVLAAQVATRASQDIAPATADALERQVQDTLVETASETPEQRVTRLTEEAQKATGIELEEETVARFDQMARSVIIPEIKRFIPEDVRNQLNFIQEKVAKNEFKISDLDETQFKNILSPESYTQIVGLYEEDPQLATQALRNVIEENAGLPTEGGGGEEEAGVGVEPPVPVTPPVEPTPEGAVAPVEPVVEPVVAEPQPAAIVPTEPVVTPKEPLPEDKSVTIFNYEERAKPIQDRIDAKIDELVESGMTFEEADNSPEVAAILEERLAMDRGAINSYRNIVNQAFTEQGVTENDLSLNPAFSIIENVYAAPRQGDEGLIAQVSERGQEAFDDDAATIKKLSEAIFKYRAEAEGLSPEGLLGPESNLTDAGKQARVDEARIAAETIHNQIKNSLLEQSQAQPEALALPPAEVAPEITPTPETPNLEPLRRVARAEQTEDDVSGLVGQGLVELYNGQPVITQAGLEALPEAERPRLNPEARKIQIDTGSNEVVAEAISKNLRIGVDQVGPNVTLPTGWTLDGDIYVPPAPQEVAPEVVAPTVEPITPEKQVVPQEQEQVVPVARVEQEQVNQGKPDVAKIINQFTVLERAAVAGKLLEEGYIDGRTADKFVKEATSEKTGGFSMQQIGDAQASADEKFNQQIAAARTAQPVAGEVSPTEVDLAAEDTARANKERISPARALKPKSIVSKTAREALAYLSSLNLVESKDWDADSGIARWRKDPNIPKPFYAQIQDAAAILSKLPLKLLDADKIISNAERNRKGGAKRFGDGDIGIPLTETVRIQTATGAFVRRSVEKPLNVATLVHEVGHTLTADAVNKYITAKNPQGSEYLRALDRAFKNKATPQPVKDLINLYKTTISQLGLEKEYFGKKGLAGGRARDSQRKAFDKKIVNNLTGNPFTWSQYYGLANIDEFVAQAWSSQSFQDLLKQIKAPDQQSVWTKFTRIIRDLFGFPTDSMASAVIDVSMQVAELEAPVTTGMTVQERIDAESEAEPEQQPERVISFSEGSPEASTLSTMASSMAKVDAASEAKGPTTYKISEIASVWMDQGGDTRQLQDMVVEYTNLTPANAKKVANAIAKQYGLQQQIAETGAVIAEPAPEVEGAPRKTSVQRLIEQAVGVRRPIVKLEVNEKTALKDQIRLKAREARETRKARKEAARELAEAVTQYVKDNQIRGPVRARQTISLAKQALKLDVNNEKAVDRYIMYVERVVENANYDKDLSDAKALRKRAKQIAKNKNIGPEQKKVLEAIGNINPSLLDNPYEYNVLTERYLLGFLPVTSARYSVMPDAEARQYLESLEEQMKNNQSELDRAELERFFESRAGFAQQRGLTMEEAESLLNEDGDISTILNDFNLEKKEATEEMLLNLAQNAQKTLKTYDDTANTARQKELISFMQKVKLESITSDEKKRFIRFANNVLANGETFGVEQFEAIAKAQMASVEAAKDKRLSKKFAAWISPIAGETATEAAKGLAQYTQSEADTLKNIFGREAVGAFRKLLGLLELDRKQTLATKVKEQIANKVGQFYENLKKKYGEDAVNMEAKTYAAAAGYFIQAEGNKTQEESIAYRRRLWQENIEDLRQSERKSDRDEAELKQKALEELTGNSNAEILNSLKSLNPASYEQLMWWKDEMHPEHKEFLKEHNENFRNQADNYSENDYLSIHYKWKEYVETPSELDAQEYEDPISFRIRQSANSIKRKEHANLPVNPKTNTKANIDINFGYNQYSALTDQIDRAYTAPAWESVWAFTRVPEFETIVGGRANANFVKNILRNIKATRSKRAMLDDENQIIGGNVALARRLATQATLGGATQPIRQVPDQLFKLFSTSGRWDIIASNIANSVLNYSGVVTNNPLLDKFPISRRGDARAGSQFAAEFNELARKVEASATNKKWAKYKELMNKMGEFWMTPLRASDAWIAKVSWLSYYEAYLNRNNIKMESFEREAELAETDQVRQEAAAQAEYMVDFYAGASDPTKMAALSKQSNNGWREFAKLVFLPLNSFALQQKSALISDARDLMLREGDRKAALAGIVGNVAGMVAFHGIRIYLIGGLIYPAGMAVLKGIFGIDMDEPDEEEQDKQVRDNWRKMKASIYSNIVAGGAGQFAEGLSIDAFNKAMYLWDAQINPDEILNKDGEVMSFGQYEKEMSPFYRYRSYASPEYTFGLVDVLTEQAQRSVTQTGQLLSDEEMSAYTPNEQAYAYFSTTVEWLYFFKMMDTDATRVARRLKQEMDRQVKEREAELSAIRNR